MSSDEDSGYDEAVQFTRDARDGEEEFSFLDAHLEAMYMRDFVDMVVSTIARVEEISYDEAAEEYLGYFNVSFSHREKIVKLCEENMFPGLYHEKLEINRIIAEMNYNYCFEEYHEAKK